MTPPRPLERPENFAVITPENEAGEKISKQAAGYTNADKTGKYQCRSCMMFIPEKKRCTVHPRTQQITKPGSCTYWIKGPAAGGEDPHGGLTVLTSGYEENEAGFGCQRCEYFLAEQRDCMKVDKDSEGVDPGSIKPLSCCNVWENEEEEEEENEEGPAELDRGRLAGGGGY